ncbi:hypothetical protein OAQ87_01825 [Candidatus Marinimicrobia bacterium]|nr:hypothetical protein [Candidatus Neomarinimicrobiota bacterium]
MNKIFALMLVVLFSFSFGREASYRTIIISPVDSYIQKKQLEISVIHNDFSDGSVEWKRRHKRRKKLRRPQRGR